MWKAFFFFFWLQPFTQFALPPMKEKCACAFVTPLLHGPSTEVLTMCLLSPHVSDVREDEEELSQSSVLLLQRKA